MPTARRPVHGLDIYDRKQRLLAIVVVSAAALILPLAITRDRQASKVQAEMYFSDPPSSVSVGQTVQIQLNLHTLTQSANAVGLVMHYDPNALDLLNMTTAQSFCTFYTENSFDTIKGEVDLDCGAPSPGFSGDSPLLVLTFRGKTVGQTSLTFDRSQTMILANDSKGTNMLDRPPSLQLTVIQTL